MTNKQLLNKMKNDMRMRNFSHYTYDSYLRKTKDIMKYFGEKKLEDVTTEELQDGTLQQKLNNYCEENKTENLYDEYDYKIWIQEKDYPTLK